MSADFDGASEILRAWRDGLMPDPLITVSQWADQHRMLSTKESAEPGRWRTNRTPYLREIMDCLSPTSPVERVVVMKGAQVGGTELGLNWVGYAIHHAPGPMMIVWPTTEMAQRNSKHRIDPLIEESPVLREIIAPARSRDSGNTVLMKEFRGGVLVMTGANSAVGLRSMPVRYLFLDEVDAYPLDVDGEGDAIHLAEARTRTFARRKILLVSTPTSAGASIIEREYQDSDQRRYMLPCPHCGHRQWLRFEQLRWERGRPETAAYVCEACDTPIAEHHKAWMLEQGIWQSHAQSKTAGFHLSSLYSPWRRWSQIAASWEKAAMSESKSVATIKAFKNSELGEVWVEQGEAPDWQRLLERMEDYSGAPDGALLLTAGADVQKDRIEVSVWGWGRGRTAWLIEHRVLMGDVATDAPWDQLRSVLAESWTHASGAVLRLSAIGVDSGYNAQTVYDWARSVRDSRLLIVKGVPRGAALIGTPTAVDVATNGKRMRRGVKVFPVVGSIAKQELYDALRKTPDAGADGVIVYPPGYVHLPKIDAEWLQQLTAEQLVTRRNRNGFAVREWQKMRERNEALDCYVYARAAAAHVGIDRMDDRHWDRLQQQIAPIDEPEPDVRTPAPPAPVAASQPATRRRRVIRSRWI
jgi:phage terminase large subunit GpA-like protein